jgi:L-arabinose isomerase
MIDLGNRFRLVVNTLEVVPPDAPLPKLPVARVIWKPQPSLITGANAWILAGGAHHFCFSQAVTPTHLEDFASMADIECVLIDKDTVLGDFKKELRWNEVYYLLRGGLK